MNRFVLVLVTCCVLVACSSNENHVPPDPVDGKTIFTGLFVKRGISLKMLLGPKFTVEDIHTKETRTYNVHYDKQTRISFITDHISQDTIWIGYADKGNSIWMLETPIDDTTFHASAMAIDNDILYGFRQLGAQQVILDQMLAEGKMEHLRVGQVGDQPVLKAERITMQPFLESALSKLEPRFKLINEKTETKPHIKSVVSSASSDIEGNVRIKFKQPGDYIVSISNNQGAVESAETGGMVEFTMNAGKAVGGSMMLTITRRTTGEFVEKLKVDVSK